MIIWQGLGILVVVSLFLGGALGAILMPGFEKVFGPSATNFEVPVMLVMAALVNWLFGLPLYKKPKPSTLRPGETELPPPPPRPTHSVFFIPFWVFTWIFLAIAVFATVVSSWSPPIPDYTQGQKQRYQEIIDEVSNETGTSSGNTLNAFEVANYFQKIAVASKEKYFTSDRIMLKTERRNFTSYCQEDEGSWLLITDILDLSAYKGSETKTALRNLCWNAARMALDGIAEPETELFIVLRDGGNSRTVLMGKTGEENAYSHSDSTNLVLHQVLAESKTINSTENENKVEAAEQKPSASDGSAPELPPILPTDADKVEVEIDPNELTKVRIWRNKRGQIIDGRFLEIEDGLVYIEKGEEVVRIPLSDFIESDKALVLSSQEEPSPGESDDSTRESSPADDLAKLLSKELWILDDGSFIQGTFVKLVGDSFLIEKDGELFKASLSELCESHRLLVLSLSKRLEDLPLDLEELDKVRFWTNKDGNSVKAKFYKWEGDNALFHINGEIRKIVHDDLCEADKALLLASLEKTEPEDPQSSPSEPLIELPPEEGALAVMRTWTNTDGRTLTGRAIELDDSRVQIEKDDGNTYWIPINNLSESDKSFLNRHLK